MSNPNKFTTQEQKDKWKAKIGGKMKVIPSYAYFPEPKPTSRRDKWRANRSGY